MTQSDFLEALFAVTDATPHAEILDLCYTEAGLLPGVRPWWPPLVEVWRFPNDPSPPFDRGDGRRAWQEARALLAALHADYVAARGDE